MAEHKDWLILREPGKVPELKGPFPCKTLAETLRRFIEARPGAFITVLSIVDGAPIVQDGPECLEMIDGRSRSVAARHRETSAEAFGAYRT